MAPIRLGTASPATQASTAKTLGLISDIAQRAASKNIDILLLPEAFIGGYPRGSAFGCVIGDRSAAGRDEFADYFDAAVDLGDTVGNGAGAGDKWVKKELAEHDDQVRGDGTREELERISRETDVFIVTGLIEKAGGSLYCAVVYVCPKNGIIGKRRKVMPTGTERLVWAQGCPSTLRAVSTTIRGTRVNLAAAICWESYMPLLRQALYSQNINLYLAPTADGRDGWLSLMRTIGVEGRCFVLSSNMCVRDGGGQQANSDATPRKGRTPSAVSADTDGCEIILPPPHSKSPSSRRRRKSVFDDDGNEIVLCSPADNGDDAIEEPRMTAVPEQATIPDARPPNKGTFVSRGGSCIVNPFGDAIAGPQWEDDQGLIYADVDLRDCIRGRLDLDAGGSYSRNDSFDFSVKGLNLDPLPY